MSIRTHHVLDSPIGPLTAVNSDDVLCGLFMHEHRHLPAVETFGVRDGRGFGRVAEQLRAYFEAKITTFDLPLQLEGTAFQLRVWAELRGVPYGETRTYGQLAAALGSPLASRAVGLANGRNPISIIVPCHRIVGSTGRLTGYGGGLPRKQQLLDHERGGTLFPG